MRKSELEIFLSRLKPLDKPKASFEQHQTPSNIAADILNLINLSEGLENKIIADFGTGNGIFAIGASVLGAYSIGIDSDPSAIQTAKENLEYAKKHFPGIKAEFINQDISDFDKKVDLVIMNPPFGFQNKDENLIFLEKAFSSSNSIYTILHSPEKNPEKVKEFLKKFASKFEFECISLKKYRFPIPKVYKFHRKEKIFINTALYLFRRRS
jgi:putative methylase